MRVELVRHDHQLALGHGEQVVDALGVQGAVGEGPVIFVFGIYRLGQVLQHGLLGQAPGGRPDRQRPNGGHPTPATS